MSATINGNGRFKNSRMIRSNWLPKTKNGSAGTKKKSKKTRPSSMICINKSKLYKKKTQD